MATQGRGDFPLRSAWFLQRRRRRLGAIPAKPLVSGGSASAQKDVFSDWLFEPASGGAASISASQTLASLSQSASVAAIVAVIASQTLSVMSQIATVSALASVSASQTLSPLSQSASVAALASVSAAQVLAGVSQSANVAMIVGVSATQTLDEITQSATISVSNSAAPISANQTLDPITQLATFESVVIGQDTNDYPGTPAEIKWWLEQHKKQKPKKRKKREEVEEFEQHEPIVVEAPQPPVVRIAKPVEIDEATIERVASAAREAAVEAIISNAKIEADRQQKALIAKRKADDEEAALLLMMM